MRAKITKRLVDSLPPGSVAFDTELPGFGIRVTPRGVRTYVLKYVVAGRQRWVSIGRHGPMTADEARTEARKLRGAIASGGDPASERATARQVGTVAELAEAYLRDEGGSKTPWKPNTTRNNRVLMDNHILPALGNRLVTDVKRADVEALHASMRETPYQANRAHEVIRAMFNFGERFGYLPENFPNPARRVEPYPEQARGLLLSDVQLARLGEVLAASERENDAPWQAVAAIRLLVLTGCRRNEILLLRWSEVDFDNALLRLNDSKTGPKNVPVGAPALQLLASLHELRREVDNPFVLPGRHGRGSFVGLPHVWERLRVRAGIPKARLHDLRHNFGNRAAGGGESLLVVGKILGHRESRTTERYTAHLSQDPLRAAADRVSGGIAAALTPDSAAEVLELRRAR